MDLLDIDLQPGQLVVRKQRRIGKLLPPIEDPYTFEGYGSADETTVLLRVPGKKHLSKAHITQVRPLLDEDAFDQSAFEDIGDGTVTEGV